MRRGSCLELYYCNMVEWFWWDSSLISTTNWFPSVLWHCWFGHLACKNHPRNDLQCVEWDIKPLHYYCVNSWKVTVYLSINRHSCIQQWKVIKFDLGFAHHCQFIIATIKIWQAIWQAASQRSMLSRSAEFFSYALPMWTFFLHCVFGNCLVVCCNSNTPWMPLITCQKLCYIMLSSIM